MLRGRLLALAPTLPCPVEFILVDDASSDNTLSLLLNWAREDPRVRVIGLARNFGHQAAVTAGLDAADAEAVAIMDADLQDPPEVLLTMLQRYCEGYDVAYGQRTARPGDRWFKRTTARAFYALMRRFIHHDLPADVGDFRLLARPVVLALRRMGETHRFLRGMVAWAGFAQVAVPYERPPRPAGSTKYPLAKMLAFAWTAAISFSPAPLRLAILLSIAVALFGLAIGTYAVARELLGYPNVPGWPTLIVTLCMIGAAILLSIGILGEYLGRVFEQVKHRPLYLVARQAGLAPDACNRIGFEPSAPTEASPHQPHPSHPNDQTP